MTTSNKENNNKNDGTAVTPTNKSKFEGQPELQGKTFVLGDMFQADKFLKAKQAVCDYVGTNYSKEIWKLVHEGKEANFPEPTEPAPTATTAQMEKYKIQLRMQMDKEEQYQQDKAKVFRVIMGQCAPSMKNKVEELTDYKSLQDNDDVAGLLLKIQGLAYSTVNKQCEYWTMQKSLRVLLTTRQGETESLSAFAKRFIEQTKMTEKVWGDLIPRKLEGQPTEKQDEGRDKYLACVFLAGVHNKRYQTAVDDLNNAYIHHQKDYPEDLAGMMNYLANHQSAQRHATRNKNKNPDIAVSFQQGEMKCFKCGDPGHIRPDCPKLTDEERKQLIEKYNARLQTLQSAKQQHHMPLDTSWCGS